MAKEPIVQAEPVAWPRERLREAMQDAWNTICSDTGCHPLDIKHEGRKLFFEPGHWANLIALYLDCSDDTDEKARTECDWPTGEFSFQDEPGEHDPCYVVMPGGAMLALNHHATPGVDIARAKFIVRACNRALYAAPPSPVQDGEVDPDLLHLAGRIKSAPKQYEPGVGNVRVIKVIDSLADRVAAALIERLAASQSAPVLQASLVKGERDPSAMADYAGADTERLAAGRRLSDYTNAEIYAEWYRRGQIRIGDPRVVKAGK